MKPFKILLEFIGLLNIFLAFFTPEYYGIINIIAGWLCLFDAYSEKTIWEYIFNLRGKLCKE